MRFVLLGKSGKRYDYFFKACREKNINLQFYDIEDDLLLSKLSRGDVIKIDPIANNSIYPADLDKNIKRYRDILQNLSKLKEVDFLNHPQDIYNTLDKKYCKKILQSKNIRTTPMLDFVGKDFEDLIDFMNTKKISQIFLKPNFGSGAVGVIALKYNRKLDRYIMQTSISEDFANTKRIRKFTDKKDIKRAVNFIFGMDFIVERWIPKDDVSGTNYDLRFVYQFGKIDFIQVRGSKSNAITNLHLNNMPLDLEKINLSEDLLFEIEKLCKNAISAFAGLKSVGFDILIEKNTKRPYIIEMNAQGDLLYKDIFFENKIYKRQVEMMVNKWREK